MEWMNGDFIISDNKALINIDDVFNLLSKTYWASSRTKGTIEKSLSKSLCFGLYYKGKQIGFARVVTDGVIFSWICDVIIHKDYRGKGLGKWLMECVINHQEIKNTKQFLATKDAHTLYEKYGFKIIEAMSRKSNE